MSAPLSCHLCNGRKAGERTLGPSPVVCGRRCGHTIVTASTTPIAPSREKASALPRWTWPQLEAARVSFLFLLFIYLFLFSWIRQVLGGGVLAGESRIAPGRAGYLPSTCRSPFRGLGTQSKGRRRTADPRASRLASALLAAAGAAEPAGSAAGPGHPFILPSRTVAPREAPGPRGRDPVDRAAGGASCTPAPNAASPERGASGFFFFLKKKQL